MTSKAQAADDPASLYKQLAAFPVYKSGQFQSPNVLRVTVGTSDHEKKVKRSSMKTYVVAGDTIVTSFSPDVPEIAASALSPSGKYLAVLRETDSKKRFVEIWAEGSIQTFAEVTEVHDTFYTDEYLFSISFSPSESKIVYTAESKAEQSDSDPFAEYRFVPDFGESYNGKKRPAVFLFDWRSSEASKVSKITSTNSSTPTLWSHPVFAGEDKIFAIAYEYSQDHRLLGVIYCPNREAAIWEITLPAAAQAEKNVLECEALKITTANMACRSPRVLYGEGGRPSQLIWISNAVGGPHATCSTLHSRDLFSGEMRTLVKSVWDPTPTEFPGLYLNTLPSSPFISVPGSSASSIVMSSVWHSRTVVLMVSLEDGGVINLTPQENDVPYNWTVFSTDNKHQLLCSRSAPNRPSELVLGQVNKKGGVDWKVVAKPDIPEDLRKQLESLKTEIINIPGRHPTETIVLRKPVRTTQPSITIPHGGPHSPNITQFNAASAALAIEGYVISYPGYTGSLGFGEKYVHELLGKIGTLDIQDCMASIKHLATLEYTRLGPGQQYLMGGSHGGFIIGNLIGQHPDFFSGALLRNPVISLGELSYSDIPDWYFEESGIRYTPTSLVTPELYQKLWAMSPISYVDHVRCPIIVMIGDKDQRVATTQGRSYYHALKGRGKDVQMLCFKDDIHPIDSVEGLLMTYMAIKHILGIGKRE